jgi:hypothetical protein
MMNSLMNILFGCSHRRTTFPFTPARKVGLSNGRNGTYVVCLDCGKEFDYDWQEMRIGNQVVATAPARQQEALSPAHR